MAKPTDPEARIFPVETRFQRLAKRAGGIPRDQAIEQATAEIEEIKPAFDDWADRQLRELIDLIKIVDASGGKPDSVENANRRCRELSDVATTMGSELVSFIADSLCVVLDSVAAGGEYNSESIACHIDALNLARRRGYRHLKPEQLPELTKGLHRVAKIGAV